MYATPSARARLYPTSGENSHSARQGVDTGRATCELASAVESRDLLKGQKAVEIMHNGSVYRLQNTKLGKLILTKQRESWGGPQTCTVQSTDRFC